MGRITRRRVAPPRKEGPFIGVPKMRKTKGILDEGFRKKTVRKSCPISPERVAEIEQEKNLAEARRIFRKYDGTANRVLYLNRTEVCEDMRTLRKIWGP